MIRFKGEGVQLIGLSQGCTALMGLMECRWWGLMLKGFALALPALLWVGGALPWGFGFGSLWGFSCCSDEAFGSSLDRAAFSL